MGQCGVRVSFRLHVARTCPSSWSPERPRRLLLFRVCNDKTAILLTSQKIKALSQFSATRHPKRALYVRCTGDANEPRIELDRQKQSHCIRWRDYHIRLRVPTRSGNIRTGWFTVRGPSPSLFFGVAEWCCLLRCVSHQLFQVHLHHTPRRTATAPHPCLGTPGSQFDWEKGSEIIVDDDGTWTAYAGGFKEDEFHGHGTWMNSAGFQLTAMWEHRELTSSGQWVR